MDLGMKDRVIVVSAVDAADRDACAMVLRGEAAVVVLAPSPGEASAEVERAVREHGRIDGVVMYVTTAPASSVLTTSAAELYDRWSDVENIVAAYRAAAPTMIERGWGRLVSVLTGGVKWLSDTLR